VIDNIPELAEAVKLEMIGYAKPYMTPAEVDNERRMFEED